jgi:S1-C subfamily serine protease
MEKVPRHFLTILTLFAVVIVLPHTVVVAEEAGTVGLHAAQLYSDQQLNKRGVLMVGWVDQGSSAAEAGIQSGDVILSVNGTAINRTDRVRSCGRTSMELWAAAFA